MRCFKLGFEGFKGFPPAVVMAALACSDDPRVQLLGFNPRVLDASFTKFEQARHISHPSFQAPHMNFRPAMRDKSATRSCGCLLQ